jgi:mycothiol synthase
MLGPVAAPAVRSAGRVMNLVVRPAVDADLPAMRHLGASSFVADPIEREALVDLLAGRPEQLPQLRLVAVAPAGPAFVGPALDWQSSAGKAPEGRVIGFVIGCVRAGIGYVDGIAVEARHRRQGVGRRLLEILESHLATAGAQSLRIGGNSWFYAWPGVDLAYAAALGLPERGGYRRCGTIQNMSLSLRDWVPSSSDAVLDDPATTRVRRAEPADAGPLDAFVAQHFSPAWRREASLALDRPVPTAFVAVRDERLVGFACHGVYRSDWFGPLGTDPAQRSGGIGEALLRRCLDDLAAAGLEQAEISWIGPIGFYTRTVGARCDRQFALFEKELDVHLGGLAP